MTATAIQTLAALSRRLNVDIRVKRDDLFQVTGGGNKGRKMVYIARDLAARGCNAIITNGGAQSNHARAAAITAAERGWKCRLVLHWSSEGEPAGGNYALCKLTGAEVVLVKPSEIADWLERSLAAYESEGLRPFQIPGGGHCVQGSLAYADAVSELAAQCEESAWWPEFVILASGTGTTQAGLLAGFERRPRPPCIIGISVARSNPRGRDVVAAAYAELREALNLSGDPLDVDFRDSWTRGGYEVRHARDLEVIQELATTEGLILDPTYTAKAFSALLDLIATDEIPAGARVLFWHTGGLLNLLSDNTR